MEQMEREIYKHLLSTYGRQPFLWVSLVCEIIRTLIIRIFVVGLIAGVAAAVTKGDYDTAKLLILLYLICMIVGSVIGAIADLLGHYYENVVYGKLTLTYYKKLTNKDMTFYRDNHTGYITAMFRQYLDNSLQLTRFMRTDGVRTIISVTIPVVVLLFASWKIGLLAALLVITQAIYMFWASSKAVMHRKASSEIYRQMGGEVADDLANIVAYKSAGKEESALARVAKLRTQEMAAFWLRRKSAATLDLPRNIVMSVIISLAFLVALNTTGTGSQAVALLVLTITYMFQIMRNVGDLPDLIYRYDDLASKLEPTLEVLDGNYETIVDADDATVFRPKHATIDINNVSFRYGDSKNRYVFKNLDLHIKAGEKIGVVGLSGAGKSTLASLLMRFDDVSSGEILIDNTDVRSVTQSSLRQQIAYVPQEPILFHRSVKDNIAYHNSTATKEQIVRAAKAAHAHEFIKELPDGYDTVVGERGVKLSGGQKQRIVIARAVLKNAPVILFDEATSALDSESEQIIQRALPQIIGNHTAIVIAHRLSTVADLDRIIVMHDGAIEEQGTHQQLLNNKGRYYSLWQKQTKGDDLAV